MSTAGGKPENSGIADDMLRAGYDRWLRLEEEKAAIGDDLKELFAELKANGFAPKALRESFRRVRNIDDADQQEHDAVVDLYVASLTRGTRAYTRGDEHEPASAADDPERGSEGLGVPGREVTAGSHAPDTQSTEAGTARRDNSTEGEPAPAALDPEAATTPPAAGRSPVDTHPEPGNGQHGEKPGSAGAPAADDASSDVSSVVPFTHRAPHDGPISSRGLPRHKLCLKVDSCAGTWREACWTCRKAAGQQLAVEAGGVQVPHHGDVA